MTERLCFLTTKRAHLFGLAKFLVGGIDPAFFEDPENPIIMTVRGSQCSGKKIFYDTAKKYLLGIDNGRQTLLAQDECNEGMYKGRRISVGFIDAAFLKGYKCLDVSDVNDPRVIAEMFMDKARGAGLTVIQNEHVTAEKEAWIDVLVERAVWGVVDIDPATGLVRDMRRRSRLWSRYAKYSGFKEKLYALEERGFIWARYVEVTVNSEQLLASPLFQRRLELLPPLGLGLPIWGENLPRRKNLELPLK